MYILWRKSFVNIQEMCIIYYSTVCRKNLAISRVCIHEKKNPLEIYTLWWGPIILQTTANTWLLDFQNLGQNEKICYQIRFCGMKQSVYQY
jgi:hypothetical protein